MTIFPGMRRRNMVGHKDESWRPPLITTPVSLKGKVRLLLDLQLLSIWKDLEVLLPKVRGVILDVGCGSQPYRSLLDDNKVIYQGLDIAESEERFGYLAPDTIYFKGSVWGLKNEQLDTVMSCEVMEHVENPLAFLMQCHDVLKPGGHIILTVPFAARLHFNPFDHWRFTPNGLHRLFRKAGFHSVVVYGRGNPLSVASMKVIGLTATLLKKRNLCAKLAGTALLPITVVAALAGSATIKQDWGEDFLGFTVTASKIDQAM